MAILGSFYLRKKLDVADCDLKIFSVAKHNGNCSPT